MNMMKYNIIVLGIKLTFNKQEYMINLHINWKKIFQSFGKAIYTETFSIMITTNFDKLMSVTSFVEVKSSL